MPVWAIVLLVVLGVLILLTGIIIMWVVSVYNSLIKLKNNVEEGYSTMDVYMKKRYDLIPNFVETVKGYAKHEKEALEKVMQARYSCMSANTPEERAKSENMLAGTLKSLFAVTENYPDLKANINFIELQNTLNNLELEIANSRKYYNGCVKLLNNKIELFPSNLVARKFNFEKKPLFEIINEEEKVVPKVQF
ncbi:MAG: LemA family protein [Clostridiales bacterium]|nr:LemA family protein [Clostridiales bacterium]